MPSGPKITSCRYWAKGLPEIISTSAPQTSVASEYIQAVAGLVAQRHLGELVHELQHAVGAAHRADLQLAVDLVDRVLDADAGQAAAIGEAGGVAEHVAEADRARRRLGDHVVALAGDPHAVVLPRRDVAADRVADHPEHHRLLRRRQYEAFIKQSFRTDESPGLFTWQTGPTLEELVDDGLIAETTDIWTEAIDNGWVSEDLATTTPSTASSTAFR